MCTKYTCTPLTVVLFSVFGTEQKSITIVEIVSFLFYW